MGSFPGIRIGFRSTIVATFFVLSASLQAETIQVPAQYATIQEAIDASTNGDVIELADGTYTGAGNKDLSYHGKAIAVCSASANPELCIIDCEGSGRGFVFSQNESSDSVLRGITVANGNLPSDVGGAIFCHRASVHLENCIFRDNSASYGGGLYFYSSPGTTLVNCVIEGNTSWEYGGGVCCTSNSDLQFISCRIQDNSCYAYGGGFFCDESSPFFTNCFFLGNQTIYSHSVAGAGLCTDDSNPWFVNCLFNANSTRNRGGALYCEYESSPTLIHCTLTGNYVTSDSGSGGAIYSKEESSPVIVNSILWNNIPNEIFLLNGALSVRYSNIQGSWPGEGNINVDPAFINPLGPDGDADTWEDNNLNIKASSPCIDAGDSGSLPADIFDLDHNGNTLERLSLDLIGNARSMDDPETPDTGTGPAPIVDMGAYEYQADIPVGDINGDGLVDVRDLSKFTEYLLGPGQITPPEGVPHEVFKRADLDGDSDVDLFDYAILQTLGLSPACNGMVVVPRGEFAMGCHDETGETCIERELPVHDVTIDSFMVGTNEVTCREYVNALNWANQQGYITVANNKVFQAGSGQTIVYCETSEFLDSSRITWNGSYFGVVLDKDDHPVSKVSWCGAAAYCNWISAMANRQLCYDLSNWECDFSKNGFRLPTEAEWEYAARGGKTSSYSAYPWGNTIDGSDANFRNSGDPFESNYRFDCFTTPVGYYDGNQIPAGEDMKNGFGLYDMSGNVGEWCNDWFADEYYANSPYENPTGPASAEFRVIRGGGWYSYSASLRSAHRSNSWDTCAMAFVGFRVVANR